MASPGEGAGNDLLAAGDALVMTDEKVEHEVGWRIGVMSSIIKALYQTVLVKRGLSGTCLFRFYQSRESMFQPSLMFVRAE